MTRTQGVNVHKFCQGLGIRVRPTSALKYRREPNCIYGGRTVARLIHAHGEDHAYRVLRSIQVGHGQLFGDVIMAVDRYIRAHRPQDSQQSVLAGFATIDLSALRDRAQRLAMGKKCPMTKRADTLAVLIAHHLESSKDQAA